MSATLHTVFGRSSVYRKEAYNHGTTAKVVWIVKYMKPVTGDMIVIRECKTLKEATQWALIYTN